MWITLCTLPLGIFWAISYGHRSRVGCRSGPEENHHLIQQLLKKTISVSSGSAGLIPSDGGEEAASAGSRLTSSTDKFPSQCLTLTVDILGRLGVELACS